MSKDSNLVRIEAEFDLEALKTALARAKDIKDSEAFFVQLSEVQRVKTKIKELEDQLISIETEAKGLINSKAKALYGDNWQVIKGDRFKITRSKTGDVYAINGTPSPKFVKIKKSPDSKDIDAYVEKTKKLPKGIEINDQRGESIRITISEND